MLWLFFAFLIPISVLCSKTTSPNISRASSLESLVMLRITSPSEPFVLAVDMTVASVSGLLRELLTDFSPDEDMVPLSHEHVTPDSLSIVMKWCSMFINEYNLLRFMTLSQIGKSPKQSQTRDPMQLYTDHQDRLFNSRPTLFQGEKKLFEGLPATQIAEVLATADYLMIPQLIDHLTFWLYDVMRGRPLDQVKKFLDISEEKE